MPNETQNQPLSPNNENQGIQVIIEGIEDLEVTELETASQPAAPLVREEDKRPVGRPKTEVKGLHFDRFYTKEGTHPFDMVKWEKRDAIIKNEKGETVFEQRGMEVPSFWSQQAANIVASKYFRGKIGSPSRETSVKQVVGRVAKTMSDWGRAGGYFATPQDADTFEAELGYILLTQRAAFNSPVWFNVGIEASPQCSACFINSVDDSMQSILQLVVTEGMLFKYGSGTGSNFSTLRSSKETLSNSGGTSSGPVSFMKGFDTFAGVIKSGGKTRRAAKMVILNADHPDIKEFVWCKAREEQKAWALIDAGYDGSFGGEAYSSIFYQNANHSVRVTDDFMKAVEADADWSTKYVLTGDEAEKFKARSLMNDIAEATWLCGDPGMQFHTTANKWHTCPNTAPINGSNPCSEFMFLDDSACNLASLNLMLFRRADGEFDVEAFKHACSVLITAQEISVGFSSYPTDRILKNSRYFRPLGIGFCNLGAVLMAKGLAYDSDEARAYSASITSLMTGWCYRQSALIAKELGTFDGFALNREPMLKVMAMHQKASHEILNTKAISLDLLQASQQVWDDVVNFGSQYGFKNAQVSVLAPTGTISFMMDCSTTGIEPDIALIKYKWLVGGGLMKMVNTTVPEALTNLGYTDQQKQEIQNYLEEHDTIEGAPYLRTEHLSVFDCAFKPAKGERSIGPMGHVNMMAAVQPFLSGAISKTVNIPTNSTTEDIKDIYMKAWKAGLKAVAVYRDGCKRAQPLVTKVEKKTEATRQGNGDIWNNNQPKAAAEVQLDEVIEKIEPAVVVPVAPVVAVGQNALPLTRVSQPYRRKMPDERQAITHKFSIGGHEGYLTVGLYEDGQPGEIFITMNKQGSVISGLMDAFAISLSMAMQYGVPVKALVSKFAHVRFEPSGFTSNPHIRIAKSIVDYVARWMAYKFLPKEEHAAYGLNGYHHEELSKTDENGSLEAAARADLAVNKNESIKNESLSSDASAVAPAADAAVVGIDGNQSLRSSTPPQSNEGINELSSSFQRQTDAPPCDVCGALMVRNGACYKCLNCGSVSGCS